MTETIKQTDDTDGFFDRWVSAVQPPQATAPSPKGLALPDKSSHDANAGTTELARTPLDLRRAMQDLLKNGWLEEAIKPRIFKTIRNETAHINALLEPFDLEAKVDESRGLAFISVLAGFAHEDGQDDDWSHPLVFRQRLTLEHSLMLALLRREFIQQEQHSGVGTVVRIALEDLLLQLDTFIDRSGSDMQDKKRLQTNLDALRKHGVVSEVDAQDYVTIRPMIVHVASPENLQALLQQLQSLIQQQRQQEGDNSDHDAAGHNELEGLSLP
ncbi:DUF4194 domain-containing protein [Lampropedia puyangensis]|uniref:DUF4194 domain-containing protein n=1 Tax=Lampropedia puyangensis TaxID=1330072 RepID=A0A4V4GSI9_9BURK|nr:DUF4194 domain-containing protein [Lampropedia puyangensis]THU05136.1 DUF4194 domain-containing protein [Lampropedia puyangensis]